MGQAITGAVTPYIFSPFTFGLFALMALLWLLGFRNLRARGKAPAVGRTLCFFLGLLLCYAVMQTEFDYYARFMFFMHRIQHMILHHMGAFLIALSNPLPVWRAAFGERRYPVAERLWRPLRRILFDPLIATLMFVGIIYFWLWPSVHFDAMLSLPLYETMNESVFIDGLIFWIVVLDPRDPDKAHTSRFGARFLMLLGAVVPQIVLGAYIVFSQPGLYDVYAICGRAWPVSPATDQVLGGLFTWIPPAMMTLVGALCVLRLLMRYDEQKGGR